MQPLDNQLTFLEIKVGSSSLVLARRFTTSLKDSFEARVCSKEYKFMWLAAIQGVGC